MASQHTSHVIFIPGFYGTRLVHATDNTIVWISAGQALFGSKTAARTGFAVPEAQELVPSTVLDRIPTLPGIDATAVDVYGDFIDTLRATLGPHAHVHLFAYDWRDSYFEAVKQLAVLVTTLKSQGNPSISLIAHSMGGLITSYYLRYGAQEPEEAVETWQGAEHIDKVVMATVPFKGSMTAFRNMKHGAKFGLNTSLIKAHAFASFRAGYEMLPIYTPVLLDHELQPLPHTLFETALWQKHGWGFLNTDASVSQEVIDQRGDFVQDALKRGKVLAERLHAPVHKKPQQQPHMLYAFATSHKTIVRAVLLGDSTESADALIFRKDPFIQQFPDQSHSLLFADGDQTVSTESAQLPSAFRHVFENLAEHTSQTAHSQIYNDKAVREKVFTFLQMRLPKE
jgi:pimeloyl-ACP methyl ester carboxylesterase